MTRAKIELGRQLFHDPLLSLDRTIACASCHSPAHAFSDTVPFSRGIRDRAPIRNTPSIMNRAYGKTFFADGRTASLEETVLRPIENGREMSLALTELVRRLRSDPDYAGRFEAVYDDGVTESNIGRALATYVRTLRSGDSPFDRFMAGDTAALSPEARAGFRLFIGKGGCVFCHQGPTFTDESFHNTGVSWGSPDLGRHTVTGDEADRGKFKTPTLRNIELTSPYMHDGSLATLEEVVEFYDRGAQPNPYLDAEIRPLRLSAMEKEALLTFLRSLRGSQVGIPDSLR